MHISAITQDYIVKSILFTSFLFVISMGLIGGCSDGGGQNSTQALTENDFAEDSSLRADPEKGVIVTFLESSMSEEAENDTGILGVDEIPITYEETVEQTFCWEDEDADAMHFMELRDGEESLILTVQANGDCITEVIVAGNYVMSIHHDGRIDDTLPIFLIPNPQELEQARKTDGLIDRFKLMASNILKRIERTVTEDAQAQIIKYIMEMYTNRCDYCNLEGSNWSRLNLIGADLIGANLRGANLRGSFLIGANLSGADLSGADLTGAILTDADLSGATWCDGMCVCASGSISTCGGCSPQGTCTGP